MSCFLNVSFSMIISYTDPIPTWVLFDDECGAEKKVNWLEKNVAVAHHEDTLKKKPIPRVDRQRRDDKRAHLIEWGKSWNFIWQYDWSDTEKIPNIFTYRSFLRLWSTLKRSRVTDTHRPYRRGKIKRVGNYAVTTGAVGGSHLNHLSAWLMSRLSEIYDLLLLTADVSSI